MSKMFDYISGKTDGEAARLEASLEHTAGYLGLEIEENQKLREALIQIRTVCDDNSADSVNHQMALRFVRDVAANALAVPAVQSGTERSEP